MSPLSLQRNFDGSAAARVMIEQAIAGADQLAPKETKLDRPHRANTAKMPTHIDCVLGFYLIFRIGIPTRATLRSFYELVVDT